MPLLLRTFKKAYFYLFILIWSLI